MKIRNRNGLTHTAFNACDKRLCDWANFLSLISASMRKLTRWINTV